MSEENKKVELNDEDLQEVTGGKSEKPKCPIYQYRGRYETCQNAYKGTYKQCDFCDLNVE